MKHPFRKPERCFICHPHHKYLNIFKILILKDSMKIAISLVVRFLCLFKGNPMGGWPFCTNLFDHAAPETFFHWSIL